MELHIQPVGACHAQRNMAVDTALLESAPKTNAVMLRHYSWAKPSRTFGYRQRYTDVSIDTPDSVDLCRRPTGGGIVDHTDDWTYSLIIPPQHPHYSERALSSYKQTHEALLQALQSIGLLAELFPCSKCDASKHNRACFPSPSPFDIIDTNTNQKLAGAAQKRTRHGLLIQGSIQGTAISDKNSFLSIFAQFLAQDWALAPKHCPRFSAEEPKIKAIENDYNSDNWQKRR
ncbi:MAG TPA: hypothetical protein DIU37_04940 [Opitutae bacterium]|nr:hypothetical protein [Opitutae bacterium]|tara:strand:- start:500 stop:1192 length:693 start_codon:yes stop_codon:yes gene_type:complete